MPAATAAATDAVVLRRDPPAAAAAALPPARSAAADEGVDADPAAAAYVSRDAVRSLRYSDRNDRKLR
jgi:hypothetical protein